MHVMVKCHSIASGCLVRTPFWLAKFRPASGRYTAILTLAVVFLSSLLVLGR